MDKKINEQERRELKEGIFHFCAFFVLIISGIITKRVFGHPEYMMLFHGPAAVFLVMSGLKITAKNRRKHSNFSISEQNMQMILTLVIFLSTTFANEAIKRFSSMPTADKAIMLVHGLNADASVMDDLANYFTHHNFVVYRLGLTGHYESDKVKRLENFQKVTAQRWKTDVKLAWQKVVKNHPRLPKYLLGYSLGGLVAASLGNEGLIKPKKYVFLTPALQLNWYTHLVKIFFPFSKKLLIPSINSNKYTANSGTPIQAYVSLFDIYREFHEFEDFKKINIESLVLLEEGDPLISESATKSWIKERKLNWKTTMIKRCESSQLKIKHLVANIMALGQECFDDMAQRIVDFTTTALQSFTLLKLNDDHGKIFLKGYLLDENYFVCCASFCISSLR